MENQEKKCVFCLSGLGDCKYKKPIFKILFSLFILFGLGLIVIFGVRTYGQYTNPRVINVSGVGEIKAVPDISTINFTIRYSSDNSDTKSLQDKLADSSHNIVLKLKDLEISEKDIKTESYNVNPKYSYQNCNMSQSIKPCDNNVIIGYEVSESISVKIRNTENVGKVLNILAEEKVTEVYGPNLEVEDLQDLKDEARLEAIKDAKSKAKILAKSLGINLNKIISFSDNSDSSYYYGNTLKAMSSNAIPEVARDINIEEGEQKIISNVSISFQIDN